MEILFSKEEMKKSLLFPSKKSDKPGLEEERVAKLIGITITVPCAVYYSLMLCIIIFIGLVEKKYAKDTWNIKVLTQKANQKCRDTKL